MFQSYETRASHAIIKNTPWWLRWVFKIPEGVMEFFHRPKYSADGLKTLLHRELGDKKLGDVKDVHLVISSTAIHENSEIPEGWFFTNTCHAHARS